MRDEQRIAQLNEGAAFLRGLPDTLTVDDRARLANLALGMERAAAFVVDRDAGASRDLIAENRLLKESLDAANATAKAIDEDFLAYREKVKPMVSVNAKLQDRIAVLEKTAPAELVTEKV